MKENELLTNVKRREENMNRVEVLDAVKTLLSLPNTELYTKDMVINYYEVEIDTIDKLISRNIDELTKNGYKVKTKENLLTEGLSIKTKRGGFNVLDNDGNIVASGSNKGIATFTKRTVLNVGMLLTESQIAKQVRDKLLQENPELYYELSKENQLRFKKYETEIKNYLEFSFGEENVKCQVRCGKYNLDFVLYNKIHIEVDESGHSGYNTEKELQREEYIKNNTNYITIRYNPNVQKPYELMKSILKYV